MKKSFKIAIATVLVLLAGTAGVLYYYLNVKEYDVADEKVEEITKNDYKVDLPNLDSVSPSEDNKSANNGNDSGENSSDANGEANSENSSKTAAAPVSSSSSQAGSKDSKSGSSSTKTADGKNNGKSTTGNKDKAKPEITVKMIKAAYRPSFESLEAQANTKIDSLVSTAYSEYKAKKESDESVSITYFYRKYTSAGKALESSTDEAFYYLYTSLEKELESRGYSKSHAKEFKTQYESAKEARESALLEKAKSAL